MSSSSLEFKVYGFYSEVAKQLDTTVEVVDTVYSWYTDNIIKELEETSARKVYLSNLGILKFGVLRGSQGIGRAVFTLNELYEKHILGSSEEKPSRISKLYFVKRRQEILDAIAAFRERLKLNLESEVISLARYNNVEERLQKTELDLQQVYEKIKRIPESRESAKF